MLLVSWFSSSKDVLTELSSLQGKDLLRLCNSTQRTCNSTQSKGKLILTRTATCFCNTNNMITVQTVIMPPTAHNLNSCQLCFTCNFISSACLTPLLFAFKTFHEPGTGCSSALLNIQNTILIPAMSAALEQIVFLACCCFCKRHLSPRPGPLSLPATYHTACG